MSGTTANHKKLLARPRLVKQRAVVTNNLLMRLAHVVCLCRMDQVWQSPVRIRGLMAFGLVVWMLWGDSAAQAQNVAIEPRPSVRITRTDEAITIDGRLDEPAWETAEVIRDFRQQEPPAGTSGRCASNRENRVPPAV